MLVSYQDDWFRTTVIWTSIPITVNVFPLHRKKPKLLKYCAAQHVMLKALGKYSMHCIYLEVLVAFELLCTIFTI